MIGSQTEAAAALAGTLPLYSDLGSTRLVYRHGSVVYKVNDGDWGYDSNVAEYENAKAMSGLPDGVYIPEVALYNVNGKNVIAMEYVEGTAVAECYCYDIGDPCDDTCMSTDVYLKIKDFLDDTAGFNTIIKANGDIYLIDLA